MKNLTSIIIISIFLSGCAASGRITQTTFDSVTGLENTVELSEYFESKNVIADEQVWVHLITTLGEERIPENYITSEKVDRSQGQIEEVTEIYFSNKSDETIILSNVYLQVNSLRHNIVPKIITLESGKRVKSEPNIRATSVYRPNIESVLHYEYKGLKYTASLPQLRTKVSALGK
jgi:hypothetical protein